LRDVFRGVPCNRRTVGVDQASAGEFGSGLPQTVTYAAAGVRCALPAAAVRDFGLATAAVPVPFAPAAFEGLVDADGLLAAQIDLSRARGGAGGGRYSLLVDTAAGPLRLRVDSIAFAASADGFEPGLPEIEALAAGLAPAEAAAAEPGAGTPPVAEGKPFEALIVKTAGTPVALPALAVERVGRHQGARANRRGAAGERIVAVDGDILPGWSLAERLDLETGAADEGWAVVIRSGGRRAVLTVGEVRGVEPVPCARVRRIGYGERVSVWLPDSGHGSASGLIEVVDPGAFAGGETAFSAGFEPADADEDAAPPERRSADRGRMAIGIGPFSCVVPEALIAEVLGEVGPDRVSSRRFAGALPLLDPAPLLGLPQAGVASGRVLVIRRPGRRQLALRVGAIAPAAPVPPWRPLPLLPPAARRLVQAVRLEGETTAFLLRDDAFDRPGAGLPPAAFIGWLGGF
ncbi:MAG: chemotaxis protein CheW, partial [Rhodospirillaceae bacterium]